MFSSNTSQVVSGPANDPDFENVTMLLHGDGTNGGQNNTFLDSSANNFTITRNGNTTQGSFSPYGTLWSNYFSGTGNNSSGAYLTAPSVSLSGDFTIELWVFFDSRDDANRPIGIGETSGSNACYIYNGGYTDASIGSVLYQGGSGLAGWNHFAFSRSGTTARVFINGVQSASGTYSGTVTGVVSIGSYVYSSIRFYGKSQYVSNLRIVNGTCLYTANFTPSTTPLTAISGTSLLTCADNRFIDASANNFTITVNGNPSVQRFSPFAPPAAYSTATIGGSGYFDGNGDFLSVPSSSAFAFGTGDFTVEAWVYPLQNYTDSIIKPNTNNLNPYIDGSGFPAVYLGPSNPGISGSTKAGIFAWNHIAVTRSSGTMRLFLNGVNVGSTTSTPSYGTMSLTVGNSGEGFFNAYLSDLRIVSGTALYTSNFTVPTAPISAVANTQLLLPMQNAAIFDNAMMNDLETVGNAQISTSVKKFGTGSIYFDGSGDSLAASNNPAYILPGDFTIEGFVYILAYQLGPLLQVGDYTNGVWLRSSSGTAFAVNNTFGTISNYTTVFPLNTWLHVAITRSGSSVRLFVQGVQVSSITVSSVVNTNGSLMLGSSAHFSGEFTNGYLDEFRITKGVARYTANFTPPTAAFPNN